MSHDPTQLLGTYSTPVCQIGQLVECEARGLVKIVRLSNARIQWPIAVVPGQGGRSLVLYGDLARAVAHESNQAVCYWWGITPQTVTKFRKSLGVTTTEGTTKARVHIGRANHRALAAMWQKARDPVRRERIAASKRGKPRPPHVAAMLRRANKRRKLSAATRARMSAAHLARPRRGRMDLVPWTEAEINVLRETISALEIAKRVGRSLNSINLKRSRLKLPDARRRTESMSRCG